MHVKTTLRVVSTSRCSAVGFYVALPAGHRALSHSAVEEEGDLVIGREKSGEQREGRKFLAANISAQDKYQCTGQISVHSAQGL